MKKYVLSAVVTGLLAPMAYAMDGGAAPPVDVEVPSVEVPAVEAPEVEVVVDPLPVDEVAIDPVAAEEVPVEEVAVEVSGETDHIRFLGPPEQAPRVDDGVVVVTCLEAIEGMVDKECIKDVNGTLTEVEVTDLASQNGLPVDENGDPVVLYSFGNLEGGELPQNAPPEGEVELTAVEDSPIRNQVDIQPNFRGGIADRGAEALAASASIVTQVDDVSGTDAPNPQLLNDEQRGAVRGLRTDVEPAKSRSGLSKLLSKFRKPKAEVTLASASTIDKSLSSKLAEIDRMRDTALRTGDQKMLAKADKLEQELRAKPRAATKIPTRTK